ncbi:MAG: formate dehydrogenase accessory sulfurtransferase FdhD [Euryarchaeota archaeon]|jgi:FdhD protein|nr:formate dehydrogenase accessory sulfurtransferase FdhD [Euryarchaeota archaeon]MBT5994293.1 formate dehydrogenase accessory sulfurtransferase FdhD [Candidatus Neomarinimicrobiota bacterium]MBT3757488.1 formate dehydrogenase accessory sulfurtransferase FdhD [Euryarchaeota archaeon]MBT4050581.1 formate dehydrogenase accessory sulfurtransferase FdhD [Euryarchaeota archaeon]MBT4650713.1 formate dehydrogenase accessory sulfurtransferase FdhD [Euryarchaeota archaeon]
MTGVERVNVKQVTDLSIMNMNDDVCIESPLSISIIDSQTEEHSLGITMRTPGDDENLALGLIYSEGIINSFNDIKKIISSNNSIKIVLKDKIPCDLMTERKLNISTSSCGICGKESISNFLHLHGPLISESDNVNYNIITQCVSKLQSEQLLFNKTGGSHATWHFSNDGQLEYFSEDVGRHNAFDKLIGKLLKLDRIPITNQIVVVSGRISFEIIHKVRRAGYAIIIGLGAPTDLSVEIAIEHGISLVGFAKNNSFTIYSHPKRIIESID